MPNPPTWLKELADKAANCLSPVDLLSPVGCHYAFEAGHWEVTLFASDTEIVGGEKDGISRPSPFILDVLSLQRLFEDIRECHWQPQRIGREDELGAHFSILGTFTGENVWLRILSRAPDRFETGRQARVYELLWTEKW